MSRERGYISVMDGHTHAMEQHMRVDDWASNDIWGRWWTSARTGARAN